MQAILTDAALVMFDKMLSSVCRRADQAHKDHAVDRAKTLDASTRALIGMAKAMLAAKVCGEDQIVAVERALGWERLNALVAEVEKVVMGTREDNLSEIVQQCTAWFRFCLARSCFAPGNSGIHCLPRSTHCATSARQARKICPRTCRRLF